MFIAINISIFAKSIALWIFYSTFFYNQMKVRNDVISSKESDFVIGKNTFEIGGRKKGQKQIDGINGGIVVKDDIEYAHGNVIPLWHFGLNY